MKKFILAATAIATLAAATLPATAATIVRDGRDGVTVIHKHRAAPVIVTHHKLHRVVFFDRLHHRHVEWR